VSTVLAASSRPGVMSAIKDAEKLMYLEGSVSKPIDIPSAVNHCKSLGYSENQIIVDIVMTDGATF